MQKHLVRFGFLGSPRLIKRSEGLSVYSSKEVTLPHMERRPNHCADSHPLFIPYLLFLSSCSALPAHCYCWDLLDPVVVTVNRNRPIPLREGRYLKYNNSVHWTPPITLTLLYFHHRWTVFRKRLYMFPRIPTSMTAGSNVEFVIIPALSANNREN